MAQIILCGTDHPAGKWSDRHAAETARSSSIQERRASIQDATSKKFGEKASVEVSVEPVSAVDMAVNKSLDLREALVLARNPLTWLPALSYLTTFGFELAVDTNLATVLFGLFKSSSFDQTKAGYVGIGRLRRSIKFRMLMSD